MTKDELLALIEAKVDGQGNHIDVGGVLASILSELAGSSSAVEVTDITAMTKEQLDALKVGDKVVKVTGNQKHLYFVTYKGEGEGEGICLSYNACGYGETVSYDRSGEDWVYNSTDAKTYGA